MSIAQLTASSCVGVFWKETQSLSSQLIAANLVYVIASDAHITRDRSFHMKEAFEKLAKEFGEEKASTFQENAKQIVNGDVIMGDSSVEVRNKKKFFGLFN